MIFLFFFFQAEDGIRDAQESRGLGDVYKRQSLYTATKRTRISSFFCRPLYFLLLNIIFTTASKSFPESCSIHSLTVLPMNSSHFVLGTPSSIEATTGFIFFLILETKNPPFSSTLASI